MKQVLILVVLAWVALATLRTAYTVEALPATPAAGTFSITTKAGGYDRTALIHIPASFKPGSSAKLPLVLAMHGAGSSGDHVLTSDHWDEASDQHGFIVVAPDGLPIRPWLSANFLTNPAVWNSGQLKAGSPRKEIDDVAYIEKLLDDLKDKIPYDEKRTYVAGHSNGGSMAFRLVNGLPDRFAALAVMGSWMTIDDPHPKPPIPTLGIYGTKDPAEPLAGGETHLPWGTRVTPPVAERLAIWAKGMNCQTEPKTISDADDVKKVVYEPKSPGGPALTVLYLDGHGHHWPGSKNSLAPAMLGPNTSKLDATEVVWQFFKTGNVSTTTGQ